MCIGFPLITTVNKNKTLGRLSLESISKNFRADLLRCTDPFRQWCPDWKLEMNKLNDSLELSHPEESMASLVAFLGKARSEKKINKTADGTNPADFRGRVPSLVDSECKQSGN